MTTSSNEAPPAARTASTLARVRAVCAATSPLNTYSSVAGSTGPWPETCRRLPARTPWENVCAGAGALSVITAVFEIMSLLRSVAGRSAAALVRGAPHGCFRHSCALGDLAQSAWRVGVDPFGARERLDEELTRDDEGDRREHGVGVGARD